MHARIAQAALAVTRREEEVYEVVRGMVDDVVDWSYQSTLHEVRTELDRLQAQLSYMQSAERQRLRTEQMLEQRKVDDRVRAIELRASLQGAMFDLHKQLQERQRLSDELQDARQELSAKSSLERQLVAAERQLKELQRRQTLVGSTRSQIDEHSLAGTHGTDPPPPTQPGIPPAFCGLEDKLLLTIFSFLTAPDVLAGAQSNKQFFRRVDVLFGMGVNLPDRPPPPPSEPAPAPAPAPAPTGMAAVLASALSRTTGRSSMTSGGNGTNSTDSSTSSGSGSGSNAAQAQAQRFDTLTKKMTSSELKSFLAMTERLRHLEGLARTLQADKEDLLARLEGAESVRDFLVDKLKTTETTLKQAMEDAETQRAQAASDHEVIAFLDRRAKELEAEMETTQAARLAAEAQAHAAREETTKSTQSLQAMVEYLKAQKEEAEQQFAGQRKVLAKEVRALRAQLATTTEQRDKFRDALASAVGTSSSST